MTRRVDGFGITMPVPDGWDERSQLIVVSDKGDDFRANLVVVREPLRGRPMESFIDDHLKTLNETFENFDLLSNRAATIGPHHGNLVDYGFAAGGNVYRQRQFMVNTGKTVYTFTYSDTLAAFEAGLPTMEWIIGATTIYDDAAADGVI